MSVIDLTILTISGDIDILFFERFSNVIDRTFYRRTGRQKRMEQKQLFIKP